MKKWEIFQISSSSLYLPRKAGAKKFDVIIGFKRSLLSPNTNYETMDCVFVLGLEIYGLKYKINRKKFQKNKFFYQKNERDIRDDGNFVGTKPSLHPCCLSWGRMGSVPFFSFEKYELQMRKKFSTFFSSLFFAQKTKSEKNFDAIFGRNCGR